MRSRVGFSALTALLYWSLRQNVPIVSYFRAGWYPRRRALAHDIRQITLGSRCMHSVGYPELHSKTCDDAQYVDVDTPGIRARHSARMPLVRSASYLSRRYQNRANGSRELETLSRPRALHPLPEVKGLRYGWPTPPPLALPRTKQDRHSQKGPWTKNEIPLLRASFRDVGCRERGRVVD